MTVSLTINGATVQPEPYMTLFEAAEAHGFCAPRLRYHPRLTPLGARRVCMME